MAMTTIMIILIVKDITMKNQTTLTTNIPKIRRNLKKRLVTFLLPQTLTSRMMLILQNLSGVSASFAWSKFHQDSQSGTVSNAERSAI
jgi:hypothetical protein